MSESAAQQASRYVRNPSLSCRAHGCMARQDAIRPLEACIRGGCASPDYVDQRQEGFPGMTGDLSDKKPTEDYEYPDSGCEEP